MIIFGLVGVPATGFVQPKFDQTKPVYMQADKMGYDQAQAIVVALGDVQVVQGNTHLRADRITYYQSQNVVRADGNVQVSDPTTGETYYAQKVQLKDDLKQGVIGQFRVRMADNSQFAAVEARKVSATQTTLRKAVYSPCKICEGQSPLWQLKAETVSLDEKEQEVDYEDLYFEVYGVPIAYTPYFSHPMPGADAKSGFLKPEYSQTTNLGTVIKVPYYLALAPDKDATITPIYTGDEGAVLDAEYRQRFDSGQLQLNGSITNPNRIDAQGARLSGNEIRGHIFAKAYNQFTDHWGAGVDIQRSSDDTYLRKYDYGNYKSLNSRLYAEGLYGRSFLTAQSFVFQGLQVDDDPDTQPLVLPLIEGYYESDAGWNGSRWFSGANTQIITRNEGADSRRVSLNNGWKVPVVTSGGQLFDMQASVRTDAYSINDQPLSNGKNFDGEKTRVIPQAALKWRYPLMKSVGNSSLTVEPTVLAVAKPNGNNPQEIPNEDNRIIEYTDVNLFNIDPMPGLDSVDNGSRVAYGMRSQLLFPAQQNVEFLFGQQYRAESDSPYPYTNQPDENFSDYVTRVAVNYQPVSVSYQARLDQQSLSARSQTISSAFNLDPLNLQVHYLTLDQDNFLEDREEILTSMALAISDEWSINGSARRDLLENQMLFASTGVLYQNECIGLLTSFKRQFTRDRDVEPDTSVTVRVSFKNLSGL